MCPSHVAYSSFHSAAPEATFTLARDHYATEEHILASGMDWTFLRDNLYLDFMPHLVGEDDVIRGPAGDGAVPAVSRDDIAASAASVLAEVTHHVLTLTGRPPASLADHLEQRKR